VSVVVVEDPFVNNVAEVPFVVVEKEEIIEELEVRVTWEDITSSSIG
jgi:hypothetical protein